MPNIKDISDIIPIRYGDGVEKLCLSRGQKPDWYWQEAQPEEHDFTDMHLAQVGKREKKPHNRAITYTTAVVVAGITLSAITYYLRKNK